MRFKNVLKLALGLLFVVLIFYYVGFDKIFVTIKSLNLVYLLTLPPLVFLSYLAGSFNIRLLLSALGFRIGFWKLFKYYMLSLSAGMFTPGRLGEFSMVYFFRKENIPIGQGAAISFLDKLISFVAASLIALVALFVFVIPPNMIIGLVVFTFLVLFFTIFFFFSGKGRYILRHYLLRSYSKNFEGFSSVLFFFLRNKFHIILLNFLISIAKWFSLAFMMHYLFLGFGVYVNPIYIFLITNVSAVLSLIPVTFQGLGFVELSMIFFYSRLNVQPSTVLSVQVIQVLVSYLLGVFLLLFFIEEFKAIRKVFNEELNLSA